MSRITTKRSFEISCISLFDAVFLFLEVGISFMLRGAIILFAFSIFLFSCATKMAYQPPLSPLPSPKESPPDLTLADLPLGEREVEQAGNGQEVRAVILPPLPPRPEISLEEPMRLPDIMIKNLLLNSQRRLVVTLANIGESPFPLEVGNLSVFVDGQLKGDYALRSLSGQFSLPPKEAITLTTSLPIIGRHEIEARIQFIDAIEESDKENNHLRKILEGSPIGPDIVVKDLGLTEDLDLTIFLSNAGEVDLRKGATFRIRVFVNNRKVSEFEHFTSEALRANFGNHYILDPPYRIEINGLSKVKISVSPKWSSDDIRLDNNVLERTFIIFPFRIMGRERKEFSFSIPSSSVKASDQVKKVKAEARWEGGDSSLMLSFQGSGDIETVPALSGKSPLKVEFPMSFQGGQKERLWRVSVINLVGKRAEGHLIIQHP